MFWNILEKQKNGKKKYVASFEENKKLAIEWAKQNCKNEYSLTLTDVSGVENESFDDIELELVDSI